MRFSEIVNQAVALFQDSGRVSYRALKMESELDDDQLDALKDELIDIQELAVDKDGNMLVWTGERQARPPIATVEDSDAAPEPPTVPSPCLRTIR